MNLARNYETAASRWAGVGPYYAMFPVWFSDQVVEQYTKPGDSVLDPFSGRGTSLFSAASQHRTPIGMEINPVGWIYAKTKLEPAAPEAVLARLMSVCDLSLRYREMAKSLPTFFTRCFSLDVRAFLLSARRNLNWRYSSVDRTAMAFILIYLHGKRDASLSNQMRQTKSMSPQYAIRWWQDHGSKPPDVEPYDFLKKRVEWRYAKGVPESSRGVVYLGDSRDHLGDLRGNLTARNLRCPKLLFTSPPYYGLTNYHYDQWLRLWLLGGAPNALRSGDNMKAKFEHRDRYRQLLLSVFRKSASLLHGDAVVYVRTDKRKLTSTITRKVLQEVWPDRRIVRRLRPFTRPTQTHLFGDAPKKSGEVDLIVLTSAS